MQLLYVSGPLFNSNENEDGAQILDKKLIAAMREDGVKVEQVSMNRRRGMQLPFWRSAYFSDIELKSIRTAKNAGARLVVSHEAFFGLSEYFPVDALIVHNYMPGFSFPSHRWLEPYYKAGSHTFMGRAFEAAKLIIFVSYRDHALAILNFPEIAGRAHVLPPPPKTIALGPRRSDVIHVSGSEQWLPKRMSRLKDMDVALLNRAGFSLLDFEDAPNPAFGIITDSFLVGFKLKLMQMINCKDVIASMVDLREEIDAIAPGYPHWCQVQSVGEAADWFLEIREVLTLSRVDSDFAESSPGWVTLNWLRTGRSLVELMNRAL